MMETKVFKLDLKDLADGGEFTGMASVFGNTDQGGDKMMAGAFAKTISDREGKFPLFYGHKVNVGVSYVAEKSQFLECKGCLNLDIEPARQVYSNMLHFKKHGLAFGMSIGFVPIADKVTWKDGIRTLGEVKLFETTLTEFPMNEAARVLSLKDFLDEVKSGRRLSGMTKAEIAAAIAQLQALLAEGAADGTPDPAAAATKHEEPVDHSRAIQMIEYIRSLIRK